MCTLMTFSRDFWAENMEAVRKQIHADAKSNSDGWALIAVGTTQHETSIIRSKRLDTIIECLEEGWWERVWIHSRHATTSKKGLAQCHGWNAGDWYIMHNGILRHKDTHKFDVDSQVLIPLIEKYGINAMVAYTQENESFCNLLLVNPEEGKWLVSRCSSGSLHTDGDGNYSSRDFASINKSVPTDHALIYTVENFKKQEATNHSGWRPGMEWDYKQGKFVDPKDNTSSKTALATGTDGLDDLRYNFREEDRLRKKHNLPPRNKE